VGRAGEHSRGDRSGVSTGRKAGDGTRAVHAGRRPEWTSGIVNPPVYRASTCVFPTLADYEKAKPNEGLFYARRGTPTQWALAEALTELEPGAGGTVLYPSGVAAVAGALLTVMKSGDHLLMVDSTYEPTRDFCDGTLARMGIETTYYDPLIGAGIAALIRPNTTAIFLESPGSLSFEVQDTPAIVKAARARNIATIMDNTWATPLRFRALGAGIDLSVQSLTKYIAGHADVMGGAVTATPAWFDKLRATAASLGQFLSPDDAFLCARGLRTLGVRLARHEASGHAVAAWLRAQPLVARVLHPALESCPGHASFARDFAGSTGVFAFTLKRPGRPRLAAMVDGLKLFAMGFSWGGFESLILPVNPRPVRTATKWESPGPTLRLSIGLEDPADLIADLEAGLARYEAAI